MYNIGKTLKETGKVVLISLGAVYIVDILFDIVFELFNHKKHKEKMTKIKEKLQDLNNEEIITKDEFDLLKKISTKKKIGIEKNYELLLIEYCLNIVIVAQLRNKLKAIEELENVTKEVKKY